MRKMFGSLRRLRVVTAFARRSADGHAKTSERGIGTMDEQEKLLREMFGDVVSLRERARNLVPLFPLRLIDQRSLALQKYSRSQRRT
jgi:hypothetical protein